MLEELKSLIPLASPLIELFFPLFTFNFHETFMNLKDLYTEIYPYQKISENRVMNWEALRYWLPAGQRTC